MDYMANLANRLTITGQDIKKFESVLADNVLESWLFLGQIKADLERDVELLAKSPDKSNRIIELIFEIDTHLEVNAAMAEACLKEIDYGAKNEFLDLEDLAFPAFRLIVFDRLVGSVLKNNMWGVMAAMAGLYCGAIYSRDESSVSRKNSKAGYAAHKESRQIKRDFLIWYRKNQSNFKSNAAAARAGTGVVPMVERVLAKWISEYKTTVEQMGEAEYWEEF